MACCAVEDVTGCSSRFTAGPQLLRIATNTGDGGGPVDLKIIDVLLFEVVTIPLNLVKISQKLRERPQFFAIQDGGMLTSDYQAFFDIIYMCCHSKSQHSYQIL